MRLNKTKNKKLLACLFGRNHLNKRGDKIISIYWFVMLILVAGGVYAMVSTYYNYPYDIRQDEAQILANKIGDCISDNGELRQDLFQAGNFNANFYILDKCSLNLDVESNDWKNSTQFYIQLNFFEINNLNLLVKDYTIGNTDLIDFCKDQTKKPYPRCVESQFYSSGYVVKILTIVKKTEKNVKV